MKIQSKICSLCQMTKSDRYGSIDTSTKEKYEKHLRNLKYERKQDSTKESENTKELRSTKVLCFTKDL